MVIGKHNNSSKMHFVDYKKESITFTLICRQIQKRMNNTKIVKGERGMKDVGL